MYTRAMLRGQDPSAPTKGASARTLAPLRPAAGASSALKASSCACSSCSSDATRAASLVGTSSLRMESGRDFVHGIAQSVYCTDHAAAAEGQAKRNCWLTCSCA